MTSSTFWADCEADSQPINTIKTEDGFLAFEVPDYVRVPQELDHESAGKRLRVVNTREVRCICGGHNALAWELQGGELSIIRCHIQQVFFTVRINQNGKD